MKAAVLKQWEQGSRKIDPSLRDELILEYAPLIKYIAGRMAVRLPPNIEVNDLINSGIIGLIDAIEKFDPKRGVKFRTYAEFRIKGAILDELRSLDWVPRSIRQKIHKLEQAYVKLEQKLGRAASEEEVAGMLGVKIEELHDMMNKASGINLINLEELGYSSERGREKVVDFFIKGYSKDPSLELRVKEIEAVIAKAINELPKKQRLVISLYYYEELTMKEIGMVLGITESRVSQIHTEAIIQLRGKLKQVVSD
ncbi:MAG: FliA/WhiG family RNA polymerase sigma factor [Pseudomonadota bacterium]